MLESVLRTLQDTTFATAIREGATLFPWIECVHVLALTMVIGSIAIVDLRLIGLTSRDRSVAQVTAAVLPITWCAFFCAAISGVLLFSSNATTYGHNRYFQVKMALMLLAGVNMGLYHLFISPGAQRWQTPMATPLRARISGTLSLSLWIAIAASGRWIGFTLDAPT